MHFIKKVTQLRYFYSSIVKQIIKYRTALQVFQHGKKVTPSSDRSLHNAGATSTCCNLQVQIRIIYIYCKCNVVYYYIIATDKNPKINISDVGLQ